MSRELYNRKLSVRPKERPLHFIVNGMRHLAFRNLLHGRHQLQFSNTPVTVAIPQQRKRSSSISDHLPPKGV